MQTVGDVLAKNNISFIYAHNSGSFHMFGNKKGLIFEHFNDCLFDIQAYVDYAKQSGYKNIIIGGHSYGANKVIYYLSENQQENINKYILISPTDTSTYTEEEKASIKKFLPIVWKYKKENKLDKVIPRLFNGYNFFTVGALLDFLTNENSKNLPIYNKNRDFSQLEKIRQKGLFVIGENDPFAYNQAVNHLLKINDNTLHKDNEIKVIPNTGHFFEEKDLELAQIILNFINEKESQNDSFIEY